MAVGEPKPLSSSPGNRGCQPTPSETQKPCVHHRSQPCQYKTHPCTAKPFLKCPLQKRSICWLDPSHIAVGLVIPVKRLSFSLKGPQRSCKWKRRFPPFSSATKPPADGEGAGSQSNPVLEGISVWRCGDLSNVHEVCYSFQSEKPVPVAAKARAFSWDHSGRDLGQDGEAQQGRAREP
uniref:Uncharacterized protein n=1 Tax=Sphaerodactylus townsendi TaxID=933632 RepID=A0ACB8G2A4_9SAUR